MRPSIRVLGVVSSAVAFGVLVGAIKGDEPGIRGAIGNLCAPWVVLPLLCAAATTRVRAQGALVGLVATLAGLVGFYATLTVVLAGRLGGGGFGAELLVEMEANRIYVLFGSLAGPVFGALGAHLRAHAARAVGIAVAILLMGEPLVLAAIEGRQLLPPPLHFAWAVADWRAPLGQAAVGIVLAVVVLALPRPPSRPSHETG